MNLECLYNNYKRTIMSLGLKETKHVILASIKKQRLYVAQNGKSLKKYSMSTSKLPPSCQEDSLGTPWGLHEIVEKIGSQESLGMVFEGRKPIGLTYWQCDDEKRKKNLITTRILRLRGMEEGLNSGEGIDSFSSNIPGNKRAPTKDH
jgi:hypothetical protein